ncbi:MAG: hypothetical protein NC238_07720 [Dehalobacter sp.]|nr:hypothetical protein [Dehalobacter sp.]
MATITKDLPHIHQILQKYLHRLLLTWESPVKAVSLAAAIFLGISATGGSPWRLSQYPYYNYLADAFLHGQPYLRLLPNETLDLSLFNGQYYLYWGPVPAVLAMPLVAIFGPQVSDVIQSIFFGAVDVGLFAVLLRLLNKNRVLELSPRFRGLLVCFFTLGTPFTTLPAVGNVWFLLQLISLMLVFLAYLAGVSLHGKRAFFWSGVAAGAVLLSRPTAAASLIFLAWYLLRQHWHESKKSLIGYCIHGSIPVLVAISVFLLYNFVRFGDPLENGISYHLMGESFKSVSAKYGQFNIHYIPGNIFYTYLLYPIDFTKLYITPLGGSLFLLSPLFFGALITLWIERRSINTWIHFISIIIGNIPILLLMGPGVFQFGPRYTLDFFIPLIILTGIAIKRWPFILNGILLGISIFHYIIGALLFAQAYGI